MNTSLNVKGIQRDRLFCGFLIINTNFKHCLFSSDEYAEMQEFADKL